MHVDYERVVHSRQDFPLGHDLLAFAPLDHEGLAHHLHSIDHGGVFFAHLEHLREAALSYGLQDFEVAKLRDACGLDVV